MGFSRINSGVLVLLLLHVLLLLIIAVLDTGRSAMANCTGILEVLEGMIPGTRFSSASEDPPYSQYKRPTRY